MNEEVTPKRQLTLLWIIRVLLARNLQNSRNSLVVIFQNVTHVIGNVLVDKNNTNIIPLGECLERVFHNILLGILLHREEVA